MKFRGVRVVEGYFPFILGRDILYIIDVSEEDAASIFRVKYSFTLKMAAADSFETLITS
jgi:hypothetical protein